MAVEPDITMKKLTSLDTKEWHKLQEAVMLVKKGTAKRIDGRNWKVYKAGTVTRIDINSQGESD